MDTPSEQFDTTPERVGLPITETVKSLTSELQSTYVEDCYQIAQDVVKTGKVPPLNLDEEGHSVLDCFTGHPLETLFGKEKLISLYATQGKKMWENYTCGPRIQEIIDMKGGEIFLKKLFLLNNFNSFVSSDKVRLSLLMNKVLSDPRLEYNFLTMWENMRKLRDYTEYRGDILGSMDLTYNGKDGYSNDEFAVLLQKLESGKVD